MTLTLKQIGLLPILMIAFLIPAPVAFFAALGMTLLFHHLLASLNLIFHVSEVSLVLTVISLFLLWMLLTVMLSVLLMRFSLRMNSPLFSVVFALQIGLDFAFVVMSGVCSLISLELWGLYTSDHSLMYLIINWLAVFLVFEIIKPFLRRRWPIIL
ncbi:hypothetical protein AN401_08730 [Zobellella denitrificans]|uniref:Uncharacterized protein n=1 Tax=Zobellella denitrificans TaxID=347534 RepID=A0A291HP92_9GAMM|nr:hypothetical protein AN401_08730 [Zobellella denitrificans]